MALRPCSDWSFPQQQRRTTAKRESAGVNSAGNLVVRSYRVVDRQASIRCRSEWDHAGGGAEINFLRDSETFAEIIAFILPPTSLDISERVGESIDFFGG